MAHILHIDCSPRAERSHSRQLSKNFITELKTAHPNDTVTYRDLGHYPVPHVDESWVAAAFTPLEKRTPDLERAIELSDSLVDEFLAADRYVIGIPMYNFNIPSTFKAYIDQIIRVNRTFSYSKQGYQGLVDSNKKMVFIVTSSGNYKPGTPASVYNFLEPYLRTIFNFIGIKDITFNYADSLGLGNESRTQSLAVARTTIQEVVANW